MRKSLIVLVFLAFCPLLVAQQTLNNDSVIKLVKAGLSDDLIVSTINASPGAYDSSANGLIALKTAGASDKVVAAIALKASGSGPSPAAQEASASGRAPTANPPDASPLVPTHAGHPGQPRIFVKADADFSVALAAAINKKHAPATVVLDEKSADYILQSAGVAAKQESGASKIARCLFAYCAGIEGSSSVSVQLVQVSDGSVVWAYQVRKGNGGPVGIQSLSEAIAKHLKNEFLDRKK
jgi:hypothetical protein